MDDDVIRVPEDDMQARAHMRRLDQLYSSPCLYCTAHCADWVHCEKYTTWNKRMIERWLKNPYG